MEKEPIPENRLPAILDIIKLDGRWAQILIPASKDALIRYLDDKSYSHIDFSCYKLDHLVNLKIHNYKLVYKTEFPLEAQENVYYDAESQDPGLIRLVKIHGFYTSKNKITTPKAKL